MKVTLNPVHSEELQLLATASDMTSELDTRYLKLDSSNSPLIGTNSTTFFQIQQEDTTPVFNVDTVNRKIEVTSETTGQSSIGAGLIVNNDSGSGVINDFQVNTDTKVAILADASEDKLSLIGFDVDGDIEVGGTDAFYLGDKNTDGSWRIIRDNNDLNFERRESSVWVNKGSITAL